MRNQNEKPLRLAILDMYDNTPNRGMKCVIDMIASFGEAFDCQVFDVRHLCEVPAVADFDVFISSGGPGSPFDGDDVWDKKWKNWLDDVWNFNLNNDRKKQVFFICHSFQMACIHFKLGEVSKRKNMSFGTYPVQMTDAGENDPFFNSMPNPFYVADFRHWQVTLPNNELLTDLGMEILALEKERPHVPLERAIMSIRFSDSIFGTQFHPEADAPGMLEYFQEEERQKQVITEHGEEKLKQMVVDLKDPEKIELTQKTILPAFLNHAILVLQSEAIAV